MKVTDKELQKKIKDAKWFIKDMKTSPEGVPKYAEETLALFLEIQSYRKVYGVLSADDLLNGATAFEKLKHGVEEAIKEIDEYFTPREEKGNVGFECQTGGLVAVDILKKHVSKYLED